MQTRPRPPPRPLSTGTVGSFVQLRTVYRFEPAALEVQSERVCHYERATRQSGRASSSLSLESGALPLTALRRRPLGQMDLDGVSISARSDGPIRTVNLMQQRRVWL